MDMCMISLPWWVLDQSFILSCIGDGLDQLNKVLRTLSGRIIHALHEFDSHWKYFLSEIANFLSGT